jgi:hypothetical protein
MKYVTIRQRRYETGLSHGHENVEVCWGALLVIGERVVMPWLIQAFAGVAAESVVSPGPIDMVRRGDRDLDAATQLATCALCNGPKPDSGFLKVEVNPELVKPFLEKARDLCADFAQQNWQAILRVAGKLA